MSKSIVQVNSPGDPLRGKQGEVFMTVDDFMFVDIDNENYRVKRSALDIVEIHDWDDGIDITGNLQNDTWRAKPGTQCTT